MTAAPRPKHSKTQPNSHAQPCTVQHHSKPKGRLETADAPAALCRAATVVGHAANDTFLNVAPVASVAHAIMH